MRRELRHPVIEIEDRGEGLLVRFFAPGSTFGSVEIVLDIPEADELVANLGQAIAFSSQVTP